MTMLLLAKGFYEALKRLDPIALAEDLRTVLIKAIPEAAGFDPDYINHVLKEAARMRLYDCGSPLLPMIDQAQSKRNALYQLFWGLLYENWAPDPGMGSSVFLQAYEDRGVDNRRKKLFGSALTPDLYADHYRRKIIDFFDLLFDDANEGAPFMALVMSNFVDLYWDLHVGVRGDAIDDTVRSIFFDFVAVFSIADPRKPDFYTHYMAVRSKRAALLQWIEERIERVKQGVTPYPEDTFVHYWLKNAGEGDASFSARDMAFECFTGFLAVSQWPLAIYQIIEQLCGAEGAAMRQQIKAALGAAHDPADPYTPLGRYVMEMLRFTTPNSGSVSRPTQFDTQSPADDPYIVVPHHRANFDPTQWRDPGAFDPSRYFNVPTSADNDEAACRAAKLARCPFPPGPIGVADGRKLVMTNSGFGTVYGVLDGQAMPVCDHPGYAPFGFGYRRCPGEQLTVLFLGELLKTLIRREMIFVELKLPAPLDIVVGPSAAVSDKFGFVTELQPGARAEAENARI